MRPGRAENSRDPDPRLEAFSTNAVLCQYSSYTRPQFVFANGLGEVRLFAAVNPEDPGLLSFPDSRPKQSSSYFARSRGIRDFEPAKNHPRLRSQIPQLLCRSRYLGFHEGLDQFSCRRTARDDGELTPHRRVRSSYSLVNETKRNPIRFRIGPHLPVRAFAMAIVAPRRRSSFILAMVIALYPPLPLNAGCVPAPQSRATLSDSASPPVEIAAFPIREKNRANLAAPSGSVTEDRSCSSSAYGDQRWLPPLFEQPDSARSW